MMIHYVSLIIDGMGEPWTFVTPAGAAKELFDKLRRVADGTDAPSDIFFIDAEYNDGSMDRLMIPVGLVRGAITYPKGPSEHERMVKLLERQARAIEKQVDDIPGDEWKKGGEDDAE